MVNNNCNDVNCEYLKKGLRDDYCMVKNKKSCPKKSYKEENKWEKQ